MHTEDQLNDFIEIINLEAIQQLPKATEHFVSDLHGEYEAFDHILRNGSGSIREKVETLFQYSLTAAEKTELCFLIYYPKEVLQQIVDVARDHDLIIFSDEIYDRLVMDDYVHVPIATLAPDRFVVTLGGLSKSHRVAGFRVGWMVLSGDKRNVKDYIEGLNMLSSMRLCSNVLSQQIIQTALGGYQSSDELLLPGGRIYEQREYIYQALNDIPGLSAVKPKAAFYIFPKIDVKRFNIKNDEQFVLDFLHEHHVLLVHGGGFNWQEPDHFRIVYLPNMDDLKATTEKMREFLATYQQK